MTMIQPVRPQRLDISTIGALSTPEQLSMQQLRHHTKNALQRLLCQVAACAGLQKDAAGRALANDLERRIHLSATVSDALFGLTQAPRSLDARLDTMARAVVELMADGDQEIGIEVTVRGSPPGAYDEVLVRIAHELVGNAVKHGMTLRLVGRVELAVDAGPDRVVMTVTDDGWGLCPGAPPEAPKEQRRGDGLRIAALLADQHAGTFSIRRDRFRTVAVVSLPGASFRGAC